MLVQVRNTGRIYHFEKMHLEEWEGTTESGEPVWLYVRCIRMGRLNAELEGTGDYDTLPGDAMTPCPEANHG